VKLLFPDACWKREIVSGALFLYFYDENVWFTLNPSVSAFQTGANPFDFFRFVENRRPAWLPKFSKFIRYWEFYRSSLKQTADLLEPLHGTGFRTMLLSYPRGTVALQSAEELLASSGLKSSEIAAIIDPFSASDELFSHIFFERYLELYEGHRSMEEMFALGSAATDSKRVPQSIKVDWSALYSYCDALFSSAELQGLLTTAYMIRFAFFDATREVLLSNPRLLGFLASFPLEAKPAMGVDTRNTNFDVVAWEFFRQLVSLHVDPLGKEAVKTIALLIHQNAAEIDALKRRCLSLALDLGDEGDLEVLQKRIVQHIRANVEGDVREVLSLDKKANRELLDSVFSDEKTWFGIAAFLYSLVHGGPALTAGAAICALSSIGSKAVKAAADRRQKLEVSDYALLYRMRQ